MLAGFLVALTGERTLRPVRASHIDATGHGPRGSGNCSRSCPASKTAIRRRSCARRGLADRGRVQIPFHSEHTLPEQRNEYFSLWSALGFLTTWCQRYWGGAIATALASQLDIFVGRRPVWILLIGVAILGVVSLGTVFLLKSDQTGSRPCA